MKQQRQAYTYALLAVLCWSTIGSAFKLSLRYMDFLTLLLFACFVAVVVLFIVLLLQGKLNLLKKIKKEDLLNSAFLGLLNPFLYYVVLLKAYELLPAQEAGTLNYIWPLVLVLLSIPMLRQKITGWSIMAILVSFFGIILISTHGQLLTLRFLIYLSDHRDPASAGIEMEPLPSPALARYPRFCLSWNIRDGDYIYSLDDGIEAFFDNRQGL
jgi:drug/metabolite transporter (DMT)-like permease